jgi:hypothetical protein
MKSIQAIHKEARVWIAVLYGIVGFFTMINGWAYLPWTKGPAELPPALVFATQLVPIWVFGVVWIVAGVVAIVTACTSLRKGWFAWSIALQSFMHSTWFMFYTVAYWTGDHRGYVGAVLYGKPFFLFAIIAILIAVLRPKVTSKNA